jgi:thioredoxin-like negative regulator of GroEL
MNELVNADPSHTKGRYLRAKCWYLKGDKKNALEDLSVTLKADNKNKMALKFINHMIQNDPEIV